MTQPPATGAAMADAVFPVRGRTLLRDHAQALQQALCAQWPWLQTDGLAAIHPLKLVSGNDDLALLSQRARLLLRVPVQRMDELLQLASLELQIHGQPLVLGAAHRRELQAHPAMYAYRVAAQDPDELAFMARVHRELDALGIACARVCGRRQSLKLDGVRLHTFSLMLHDLAPEHALRLQQMGLGPHRLLGCGVFVPHKSAAAVR